MFFSYVSVPKKNDDGTITYVRIPLKELLLTHNIAAGVETIKL